MSDHAPLPQQTKSDMGLLEHLQELRTRLAVCAGAVLCLSIVAYFFSEPVFAFLCRPFYAAFPNERMIGTGPAEAFLLKLKVAFFCGIILAMPILAWQLWLFIAPGLYPRERNLVWPFVLSSSLLFALGAGFSYYAILPLAFGFFQEQYASISLAPAIRLSEQLSATVMGLLAFGLVFELPVIAFFLARLSVITADHLTSHWRLAIVLIFIISAILTPPDVLTQFLMAAPLVLLYGISIIVVRLAAPRPEASSLRRQTVEQRTSTPHG